MTQISIDNVAPGDEIPPLVQQPTNISNFLYGVALWAAHRIHYDKDWAVSEGYKDILIIGDLTRSYVVRMLVDWAGDPGALRKLSLTNMAPAFPGDTLTVQGIVRTKTRAGDDHLVECDVFIDNHEGTKIVVGSATLRLPSAA